MYSPVRLFAFLVYIYYDTINRILRPMGGSKWGPQSTPPPPPPKKIKKKTKKKTKKQKKKQKKNKKTKNEYIRWLDG